jgi:hypothetical protein
MLGALKIIGSVVHDSGNETNGSRKIPPMKRAGTVLIESALE